MDTKKRNGMIPGVTAGKREQRGPVAEYIHDIWVLASFCGGQIMDKGTLVAFKNLAKGYATASINSMLAAVNRLLDFTGFPRRKLRHLKV